MQPLICTQVHLPPYTPLQSKYFDLSYIICLSYYYYCSPHTNSWAKATHKLKKVMSPVMSPPSPMPPSSHSPTYATSPSLYDLSIVDKDFFPRDISSHFYAFLNTNILLFLLICALIRFLSPPSSPFFFTTILFDLVYFLVEWMRQICNGVLAIHKAKLVHRYCIPYFFALFLLLK